MARVFLATVILAGFLIGPAFAEEEQGLFWDDAIGGISIGMPEREVRKMLGPPSKRGREEFWAADGAYHQTWKYEDRGVTLGMVSEKRGGKKDVGSISIKGPRTLATKRGIMIGSTERQVINAYKDKWNREDSKIFGGFIAGSVYGGLMFKFKNGRVSEIFFGAAAE